MIEGWAAPGFEGVRSAFRENFTQRGEVGAAFEVWRDGSPVVQLWGGVADMSSGRRWRPSTHAVLFSATKGAVAAAYLCLVDRGLVDLESPVARYWPGFAQGGKGAITVRTLLNHRSGLSVLDAPLELRDFADPEHVESVLEAQVPLFEPGTGQAYGATAWGAFVGALFRRITGTSVGRWLREHLFDAAGGELRLGGPMDDAVDRAFLRTVQPRTVLTEQLPEVLFRRTPEARFMRRIVAVRTWAGRAMLNPRMLGRGGFGLVNDPEILALELPGMNAMASARGLARLYAALVSEVDGKRLVAPSTVEPLRRRQTWSDRDPVLQKPSGWSQGFVKEETVLYSPNAASFGHPGAGGAFGWADPDHAMAMAYVTNQMDWRMRSPRALALAHATYAALDAPQR